MKPQNDKTKWARLNGLQKARQARRLKVIDQDRRVWMNIEALLYIGLNKTAIADALNSPRTSQYGSIVSDQDQSTWTGKPWTASAVRGVMSRNMMMTSYLDFGFEDH